MNELMYYLVTWPDWSMALITKIVGFDTIIDFFRHIKPSLRTKSSRLDWQFIKESHFYGKTLRMREHLFDANDRDKWSRAGRRVEKSKAPEWCEGWHNRQRRKKRENWRDRRTGVECGGQSIIKLVLSRPASAKEHPEHRKKRGCCLRTDYESEISGPITTIDVNCNRLFQRLNSNSSIFRSTRLIWLNSKMNEPCSNSNIFLSIH